MLERMDQFEDRLREDWKRVERIEEFIRKKHAGQVDKQGEDYFDNHLMMVRILCGACSQRVAVGAIAHDVLEDTNATENEMLSAGFTPDELDLVVRLTKKPGESYTQYLYRVKEDPDAVKIKVADLTSNLSRMATLEDQKERARLVGKYHRALQFLTEPRFSGRTQVRERIYTDIEGERRYQYAKWGKQVHNYPIWTTILTEEVGEVAEAALMHHFDGNDNALALREELVQVAAVSVAIIEQIDEEGLTP